MDNRLKVTVDSIVRNGQTGELTIVGWSLDEELKLAGKIIVSPDDFSDISVKQFYRMDINTLFQLPNEVSAGFEIKGMPKKKIGKGKITFSTENNSFTLLLDMMKSYPIAPGTETPLQSKLGKVKKGVRYLQKNGISSAIKRYQLEKKIGSNEYLYWIMQHENWDLESLKKESYEKDPLISVVIPVYNADPKWLGKAIESVQKQTYNNWEICLCNDASTDSATVNFLENLKDKFPEKIKVISRKENGHISKATNDALSIASGEYIAFMDQDDELAPIALQRIVATINEKPELSLIYSDEDKMDENGKRYEPNFKPDWSPDLLMGTNYISHLSVYKKSLIDKVNGLRAGYEGAQDYDLVLRATEIITVDEIHHIPEVLYHWRAISGSTAKEATEKDYANEAGKKALEDTFLRRKIAGKVEYGQAPGFYNLFYDVLNEELVSIIIPTKNGYEDVKTCVDSIIEKTDYKNFEIIIADNGSDDPKMNELYTSYEKILGNRFIAKEIDIPFNYSRINNIAAESAQGKYLLFLNNDTEVIRPDWLRRMVSYCQLERVGCVGAKLFYPDNTIQHAGVVLGLGDVAGHGHHYFPKGDLGYFGRLYLDVDYLAVTAACVLVKKADFAAVSGFDEDFVVAFNDIDLCLRIYDLGRYNVWCHLAELYHFESKSRGYENTPEKIQRFDKEKKRLQNKWRHYIDYDPFYSPNLTRGTGNFTVRTD